MKRKITQWKKFAAKVADIQASILLFIVFLLIITPLGLFMQMFSRQTLLGKRFMRKRNSYWLKRTDYDSSLDWAKRQ